jgi:hypothetical protein
LHDAWTKLSTIEAHTLWSKDLEPHVVSATPRWRSCEWREKPMSLAPEAGKHRPSRNTGVD